MFGKGDRRISTDREIFAMQIDALYRHLPMVLVVNLVNSGLVTLVLAWHLEQTRWWLFFGVVITLTAARAVGWRYYRRRRKPTTRVPRWALVATVGSGLSGLLWGISSACLRPDDIV